MRPTPWGGSVVYRQITASTMDDARQLEDQGEPDGSLVWAGFQTAGRGRHPGRVWRGEAGDSLMFTVYWKTERFRVPSFAPSLTVGLGLCLWLEDLGLGDEHSVGLKWPNDVYLSQKKLAGILVRQRWGASAGTVHAGIGINLKPPSSGDFRTRPGSLAEAGHPLEPEEALYGLLPALALALNHPDPRSACETRLWRRGQSMELSLPGNETELQSGTVIGLDETGRLVWDGPRGRELLSSGE